MRREAWGVTIAAILAAGIGTVAEAAECSAECSGGQCHIRLDQRDGPGEHLSVRGDGQFVLAGTRRDTFETQLTTFATTTIARREPLQSRLGDTAERFLDELEQALLKSDWQHLVELRRQLQATLPGWSANVTPSMAPTNKEGAFCGCSLDGQPACERL